MVLTEIYAAREKNIYGVKSQDLVEEIKKRYPTKPIHYFDTFDQIADFVNQQAEENDLVLTMGAGDIYKVAELILEKDWQ